MPEESSSSAASTDHVELDILDDPKRAHPQLGALPPQHLSLPATPSQRITTTLLQPVDVSKRIELNFSGVSAFVPMLFQPTADAAPAPPPAAAAGPKNAAMTASPLFTPMGVEAASTAGTPPLGGATGSVPAKHRQVLFDVSGTVLPCEALCLMGPSGSGKTSLLSLLGGRSTARTRGTITFNGARLDKTVKRKLGFVTQDDLLFGELTVYETLYFAALLRLPRAWSREAKLQRVEMVLTALGLAKCRDTLIGGYMTRGVSGGERKRVSICFELLINPSVLFLDEPTSGLDSTTALQLVRTLRTLASGGRAVVCSIHQPSSRIFQQMDKLMLLSEGHVLYYGSACEAVHWFDRLGAPLPRGVSIAEHILDLASGDLPGQSVEQGKVSLLKLVAAFECRMLGHGKAGITAETLTAMAMKVNPLHECRDVADPALSPRPTRAPRLASVSLSRSASGAAALSRAASGAAGLSRTASGAAATTSSAASESSAEGPSSGKALPPAARLRSEGGEGAASDGSLRMQLDGALEPGDVDDGKWGAPWVEQFRLLTSRSIKIRRSNALAWQNIVNLLIVGVLCGIFWFQSGDAVTQGAVIDIGGLLLFILMLIVFSTAFSALFTFPPEFLTLVKERQSGMFRLSAYYAARTAADIPMVLAVPSVFCIIAYFMAGLRLDAGSFFSFLAAVLLIVLVSQSIGLLVSALVVSMVNAQTFATVLLITLMLVTGFYVRDIPVWIAWLKWVSFMYYGWNLLLKIQFGNRSYPCDQVLVDNPAAAPLPDSLHCTVNQAGIYNIDLNASVTEEVLFLLGFFVLLRVGIYYALRYKTTFRTAQ